MYIDVYGKKRFLSVFICLMFTVVIQAGSQVNFPKSSNEAAEISIYNAAGKLVVRRSSMPGGANLSKFVWDCSGLGRGVYFTEWKKWKPGVLK
jgi:hypothetical protein